MSIVPGWHTTIFAPYFVAGAIFSGSAMVLTLVIPMRRIFRLENYIRIDHFESLAKIVLITSLIVGYSYIVEFLLAFYSGHTFEEAIFLYRALGDYHFLYWLMLLCNVALPLLLFIKKLRRSVAFLFVLSIFINIGMWLERFVIIVSSLAHEYTPYAWGTYLPSLVEVVITIGSFRPVLYPVFAILQAIAGAGNHRGKRDASYRALTAATAGFSRRCYLDKGESMSQEFIYANEEQFKAKLSELRSSGVSEQQMTLFSPYPVHGLDEILAAPKSNVRFFTLFGGVTGFISGMGLTIFTVGDVAAHYQRQTHGFAAAVCYHRLCPYHSLRRPGEFDRLLDFGAGCRTLAQSCRQKSTAINSSFYSKGSNHEIGWQAVVIVRDFCRSDRDHR